MRIEQFYQFVAMANAEQVLFYYSGALNENAVAAIGDVLRRRLQTQGASGATARKVFSAFVEMAQNILHYSADPPEDDAQRLGALAVALDNGHFAVMCGNRVRADSIARLQEKLESVQAMSPDEVRQAYKQQLRAEEADSDSKGAGLGLLTIAHGASAPIEFEFANSPSETDGSRLLFLRAIV